MTSINSCCSMTSFGKPAFSGNLCFYLLFVWKPFKSWFGTLFSGARISLFQISVRRHFLFFYFLSLLFWVPAPFTWIDSVSRYSGQVCVGFIINFVEFGRWVCSMTAGCSFWVPHDHFSSSPGLSRFGPGGVWARSSSVCLQWNLRLMYRRLLASGPSWNWAYSDFHLLHHYSGDL